MTRQFNIFIATLALLACSVSLPSYCQEETDQADAAEKPAGKAPAKAVEKPADKPHKVSAEAIKHYNRGLEFHQSGFLAKAIDEYKLAILSDDRLEQAYSNLGLIYIAQKSYVLAQEAFDKALFLKPNRPTSLNGLASVLYARGQADAAIEKWQKAVTVDPRFASAYFNMGTALESKKKNDEALVVYAKAVSIAPDMADAFYHMGNLLNKQKHLAQALVLYKKAVDLSPESEFARDARKQISGIESQFAKENGKENKNKIVGELPPSRVESPSVGASRQDIIESAARNVEKKKQEKEQKALEAAKAKEHPVEKPGLLGLVKRKPKADMKMFVHPPQSGEEQKTE